MRPLDAGCGSAMVALEDHPPTLPTNQRNTRFVKTVGRLCKRLSDRPRSGGRGSQPIGVHMVVGFLLIGSP